MNRRERTHLLALAALLHDVGKVGQRAKAGRPSPSNVDLFCRKDREGHYWTHQHAAWTADFIEEHLRPVWEGLGGEQILRWAAAHHVPSPPLEWIVAEADRLASGMDRPESEDHGPEDPSGVPLESVLSRVMRSGTSPGSQPALVPMRALGMVRENLFPTDKRPSARDYEALWTGLCEGAKALSDGFGARLAQEPEAALAAISFLLERYTWCVPASTVSTPRDVSLWDHSRSAAAIAACIAYDARSETDEGYVRDRSEPRYALVCADLSGIQNYLHALKAEGARRSLTGRSFYVQLLQDAVARAVCSRWDLPLSCALYQGGGKVWFLTPARVKEEVCTFAEELDLALWTETGGLLGFGVGVSTLSGQDLLNRKVGSKWVEALEDLQSARLQRMKRLAKNAYQQLFEPSDFQRYSCAQCERETDAEDRVCSHCRMTENIGRVLGRMTAVVPTTPGGSHATGFVVKMPLPLDVCYVLLDDIEEAAAISPFAMVMALPEANEWQGFARKGLAVSWWPLATSESIEFSQLAERNPGVPRLAVLRADVDGLGDLFERGFSPAEQTLSRLAALSRAVSVFFGGYLPTSIRANWGDTVRAVFCGGDDVFLVGSFFVVPQVAKWLRDEWRAFGGGNPALSVSAGIAVQAPKAPLLSTARRALDAEHAAKSADRNGRRKDAVSLFGEVLSWQELERAGALVGRLVRAIGNIEPPKAALDGFEWPKLPEAKPPLPRSFLRALGDISACYRIGQIEGGANVKRLVNSHRWRWVAAYALARTSERQRSLRNRAFLERVRDELLDETQPPGDLRPMVVWLNVAVEWAFLLTRIHDRL